MGQSDTGTISHTVTEEMRATIAAAGITDNADLIARILATGIGLGIDGADRLDLKIASSALTEMRAAFRLFAPYEDVPKVTIFGSARTLPEDALYRQASEVAAALAEHGWMVVTGAGPGIMQAAAEGAGPHNSLGVSIRLPFEEKPNAIVGENARNVAMKYFFTRKLMLVKESSGFVCVPGGFGTLDEMFELLTLQQTGKADPTPIVLLDAPGGTFWSGLRRFIDDHLRPGGVISEGDFDRVLVTDSVTAAVEELSGFYRNYSSLRWVGKRLVLRLKAEPTDAEVEALNAAFGDLVIEGRIERRGPLRVEVEDDDQLELPRLVLRLNQFRVGELHRLIRAINALASAPKD
ncbi:Rossman fold protein, TIGR00730 family [Microbacterium sp. B35-04]|uniref:LOG family protein n=1 Tax=unclassified Microbacterium TaxID=2609290 RepID=UPI0013D38A3B|nr:MULTISPECIES: TIGR00730 family Rossman fold protein [unclassified Microbacterium]KAF2414554.1 Rossman fold protein, TIGR00730 family [Microbacterium sp. B35-04]KAF2418349.1 Rossman fold protein, TIGR00730 family [Microbacterium sp. B35-30]